MNNCKEYLDDVIAITAIPLADLSVGTSSWQLSPTIPVGQFSPTLSHAITIGIQPATTGGMLIPIKHKTGKVKDDESDSVAGRLHTVNVQCDIDGRSDSVWERLLKLERESHHLILTFRDGTTRAFVSATEDTYLCHVERDGAKTSVTFKIQCLMGVQLIV